MNMYNILTSWGDFLTQVHSLFKISFK